jgi:hypothetical protein
MPPYYAIPRSDEETEIASSISRSGTMVLGSHKVDRVESITYSHTYIHLEMSAPATLYKMDINGIVYLIDPATTNAYTYDTVDPTLIGRVIAGAAPGTFDIELVADWEAVLRHKIDRTAVTTTPTV